MSKTVTIGGFVYAVDYGGGDKSYYLMTGDDASDRYWSLIGPVSIEYTIPADFDPRASKIAALEAKRAELRAQFAAAVTEIDRQISQYQAISNEVAA